MNEQSLAMTDVQESTKKWPTMKEIVDLKGPFIRKWNVIFIISCVFAVLLDPLFLYIPIVNEEMKCMRMDSNLKITALVLRSLTDLFFMLNIFLQVFRCNNFLDLRSCISIPSIKNILLNTAKTMSQSYILIDILAILPLPQVAVLILLFKIRGSSSLGALMNFLVLVQYVPRVIRIYLSCKESAMASREQTPTWIKGVLNLFLYILASHVFGAFWYFFAVQRVTTCWQNACRRENRCESSNFECHDYPTLRNNTFLSDSCPIDPANAKVFDFGMFLDVLQFGIVGSTNYVEKFPKCFWWGLRNLSSLGSNLPLSINTWENLFAAFVSIIGLLLFLYLMGNLQTYMQLDVSRLENLRWKKRINKKMELLEKEVEKWMAQNGLPSHKKSEIIAKVLVELKEDRDVNVEDIMSILPLDLQDYVKSCMPLSRLRKVPLIQNMDEAVLREISECLKPRKYKKDNVIIEEDKPLMMIFIVDGLVSIEMRGCSRTLQRGAEKLYGEHLLRWPVWTSFSGLSNESVIAIADVEVLVLMGIDVVRVGSKFRSEFDRHIIPPLSDAEWMLLDTHVAMLRKVPKWRTMDPRVLKAISLHLKPMSYNERTWLIIKGEPLRMMIFVLKGSIIISKIRPGYEKYDDIGDLKCNAGYFVGEELLDWVLDRSFPALLPLSTFSVYADEAEILVLMPSDLASVVNSDLYMSNFSTLIAHPTDLETFNKLYLLKKVPLLEDKDEAVLREMCKYLKRMTYKSDDIIIPGGEPLAMLILIMDGSICLARNDGKKFSENKIYFGEQLLHGPPWKSFVPPESVIPYDEVDLFAIMASDTEGLGHILGWDDSSLVTMLTKVPRLGTLDAVVLKAISLYLKPMRYVYNQLIGKDAPVRLMIFVVGGSLEIDGKPAKCFVGEELLDWVLDKSFPAVLPISTRNVSAPCETVDVLLLMAEDLASVASEYQSNFSEVFTRPPTDLMTVNMLYWLKRAPVFRDMDEEVLKEISKHMKPMSYSTDTAIIEQDKPLEMMFVFLGGESWLVTVHERSFSLYGSLGSFYGLQLVHWITYWASHTSFPAELPLSPCSVTVKSNNGIGNAECLVLRAEDLKHIVSKFRPEFMKKTSIPIDFEGKLATMDPFTMLKKVPTLENVDEKVLEAICSHLKPMKYRDDTTEGRYMFKPLDKIDKMFFIISGLVSYTVRGRTVSYRYSGNYFGEELLEWVLDGCIDEEPTIDYEDAFSCVGEVEVLVLKAKNLTKVVSEFKAHFERQIPRSRGPGRHHPGREHPGRGRGRGRGR